MKQIIYGRQTEWSPTRNAAGKFSDYAKEVGLDVGQYDECMKSAKFAGRIQASVDEGKKLGVNGTPTFLIGGRLYPWTSALGSDSIRVLVRALLPKPTQ